ncbi:MAG: hypothetical protein WCK02_02120 [Bacteroidota bacterium]
MKVAFTLVLAKINAKIKANGNRQITASDLNEILVDIIGSTELFQLKNGVPVDTIYNSGAFAGDKSKTLLTWQAVSSLLGGKIIPIIGPGTWIALEDHNYTSYCNGTVIGETILQTGNQIVLSNQTLKYENGLYIVGENQGDTVRHELYPTAESLKGTILTFDNGTMLIGAVDSDGDFVTSVPMPEYDERIVSSEEKINTLTNANSEITNELNQCVESVNYVQESLAFQGFNISNLQNAILVDKGFFATPIALQSAFLTGDDGWRAIVGSTDTVWIWDSNTNAWVNSGATGLVSSVNGQTGAALINAQSIYDNSSDVQILTNAITGAFGLRNGNANNLATIFQIKNYAGSIQFSVKGSGEVEATALILYSGLQVYGQYKFPDLDGIAGQIIETNGSGQVSWVTPSVVSSASIWTINPVVWISLSTFSVVDNSVNQAVYAAGRPLKYKVNGIATYRYGIVKSYISGIITILGYPLTASIQEMNYGLFSQIRQETIFINGAYADNITSSLNKDDNGAYFKWNLPKAHIVQLDAVNITAETGITKPIVNAFIGANPVLTVGVAISNAAMWYNSGVDIAGNYDVNFNDIIEIGVSTAGTNGVALDLTACLTFVLE